jgi:hypothetical protein
MEIKLEEPRKNKFGLFRKNLKINKAVGENIIFIGTTGSGTRTCQLKFYDLLMKENLVNEKSIFINSYGENSAYINWMTTLNDFKDNEIRKEDVYIYNLMDQVEFKEFKTIKFAQYNNLQKPIFFNMNYIERLDDKTKKIYSIKLAEYLNSLPINKGKEIPIIINEISFFKLIDYKKYSNIIKDLNKKGYFLIASISSSYNPNEAISYIKESFNHIILMKIEIRDNELDLLFPNMFKNKKSLWNLNDGQYYYLNNFIKVNSKPLSMPFNKKKLLIKLPDYLRIKEMKEIMKIEKIIKNF